MQPVSVTPESLLDQPGGIQRSNRGASGSPLPVTIRLFSWLLALIFLLVAPFALAAPTTPTEDFTDNLDGTVTHRITGLTWMRCAMGMTWTGTTCTGTASTYTWDEATKLTLSFAGKSDWRLPSIAELNTIVERESKPAINGIIFPNIPGIFQSSLDSSFWSISNFRGYLNYYWLVDFGYGGTEYNLGPALLHVRLVRSSSPVNPLALNTPTADFYDNKDGTVTHLKTGLMWKRCAEGQSWDGTNCNGPKSTFDWATARGLTSNSAGYSDWRLPNQNELLTLVEYQVDFSALNFTIFPSPYATGIFWSSSKVPLFDGGLSVNFSSGTAGNNGTPRDDSFGVRLVRRGQFFSSAGFVSQNGVAPNTSVTSNVLKVFGVSAMPISIVNGSYSINNGPFNSTLGTVKAFDIIEVRVNASASLATTSRATLTVGAIGGDFIVTTALVSDSAPPTIPIGFKATMTQEGKVVLAWSASSDNLGVAGYRVYRNGLLRANVESVTSYSDAGLIPESKYTYWLQACDAANNWLYAV